jgi:hypothetical protein
MENSQARQGETPRLAQASPAVDAATHAIVAAEVSLETVGDNEVLPTLLNPLRRKIEQVSADGAYDTRAWPYCKEGRQGHHTAEKNAAFWKTGHPRNEAVAALKAGELEQWKRTLAIISAR